MDKLKTWGFFFVGRPSVSCERINSMAAKLIDDDDVYYKIMTSSISDEDNHHDTQFYDYMGDPAGDVGSDDIVLTACKVVRWFKPITLVRQHEQRFCGPDALLNGTDEKFVLQLGEVVTKFYLTDKAKLSDLVSDFNRSKIGYRWSKIDTGRHTSFECIFDSIINIKTSILVVAYMHNRDSNHCINIDCSQKTILDTDKRNPNPFFFSNKQEFISILCSYFSIDCCRVPNVMCVYEGITHKK